MTHSLPHLCETALLQVLNVEKLKATPQWKREQRSTGVATEQVGYSKLVGTLDMHGLRKSSTPTARTK